MPRFGVNFIGDVYFVVEADDEDEAVDAAYELLYTSRTTDFDWGVDEVDPYDEDFDEEDPF